jgi:hypothetical protein
LQAIIAQSADACKCQTGTKNQDRPQKAALTVLWVLALKISFLSLNSFFDRGFLSGSFLYDLCFFTIAAAGAGVTVVLTGTLVAIGIALAGAFLAIAVTGTAQALQLAQHLFAPGNDFVAVGSGNVYNAGDDGKNSKELQNDIQNFHRESLHILDFYTQYNQKNGKKQ